MSTSTLSSAMGPLPTSLLCAILRPSLSSPAFVQHQLRAASKVSLLDKLHRKQRKAVRQERLDSVARANAMPSPTTSTSSPTPNGTRNPYPPTSTIPATPSNGPAAFATTTIPPSNPSPTPPTLPSRTPYTITRTPSQQLPIYHLSKAGGNKHLTKLRKIDGDLNKLKSDIRAALGVEDFVIDRMGRKKENVAINWTTRQIVVKGWRRPELVKWAEGMGF
jgi:large subunit ribosomal protein L49